MTNIVNTMTYRADGLRVEKEDGDGTSKFIWDGSGILLETDGREAGMTWHNSILNPIVTIQVFFLQILHGNTACEHLSHLTGMSFTAAAYCKTRMWIHAGSSSLARPIKLSSG